jgi:hypothetical protein
VVYPGRTRSRRSAYPGRTYLRGTAAQEFRFWALDTSSDVLAAEPANPETPGTRMLCSQPCTYTRRAMSKLSPSALDARFALNAAVRRGSGTQGQRARGGAAVSWPDSRSLVRERLDAEHAAYGVEGRGTCTSKDAISRCCSGAATAPPMSFSPAALWVSSGCWMQRTLRPVYAGRRCAAVTASIGLCTGGRKYWRGRTILAGCT